MNEVVWSGHVQVQVDEHGHKSIVFQKDGDLSSSTYTPSGMMENAAVNHLVQKLEVA